MARKKGPRWSKKRERILTAQNHLEAAQKALAKAIKDLAEVVATDPGDPSTIKS